MGNVTSLTCVVCGANYTERPDLYTCPVCGELATLRVSYDYESVRNIMTRRSLDAEPLMDQWRYLPLLPLQQAKGLVPLRVGGTPLYSVPVLRKRLGFSDLWVKDDTINPSGSLKDRASVVTLLKGLELGYKEVAVASTGNAAASLACFSASMGVRCHIYVPAAAPRAKLAQLAIFGADVVTVQGSYDDAFKMCIEACEAHSWYNRNTGYNPYTVEGKKTVSMEVVEQLAWSTPDTVIVPTGDGCILSGVWKGFVELHQLGLIDHLPRLIAAQASGSQAIKLAFDGDGIVRPVDVDTIADSIAVSVPRNGVMAVQDLHASGGMAVAVSDDEILEAMKLLGQTTGVFGEPAGVISLAVLLRLHADGNISSEERVVVMITGSGLKDVDSALKSFPYQFPQLHQ